MLLVPPAERDKDSDVDGAKRRSGEWFDLDRLEVVENIPDLRLSIAFRTGNENIEREVVSESGGRNRGSDAMPPENPQHG